MPNWSISDLIELCLDVFAMVVQMIFRTNVAVPMKDPSFSSPNRGFPVKDIVRSFIQR